MKDVQLQKDFLQKGYKYLLDGKREDTVYTFRYKDVDFIGDKYTIFALNGKWAMLDLSRFERIDKSGLLAVEGLKDLKALDYIRVKGKLKLKVFEFEDGTKLHAQEKYFKYFDGDMSYMAEGKLKVLHCYEDGELIGLICPVKVEE